MKKSMRDWFAGIGLAVVMGIAALLSGGAASAQKASMQSGTLPAPRSFSNKKAQTNKPAQPKPAPAALKTASQEDLAEAILGDAITQLVRQTDHHHHAGEYEHCINLNRIVVQGDPHNVNAFADIAYLLWSTDRADESVTVLKQGLKANPDNYFMYDNLGQHLYLNLHRTNEAIPYLEKATSFTGANACPFMTWNTLAHCYEKTNQWDKAVHTWEKAVMYVDNKAAPVNLKRAQKKLAELKGSKG